MLRFVMTLYQTTLPFPPSVNGAYGGGSGQKRFKSKSYKNWLSRVDEILDDVNLFIMAPVRIEHVLYMPDKRNRDIGNYEKVVTDLMVSKKILFDDNHNIVREVYLKFGGIDKNNPRVEVKILKTD